MLGMQGSCGASRRMQPHNVSIGPVHHLTRKLQVTYPPDAAAAQSFAMNVANDGRPVPALFTTKKCL